MVFLTGSCMAYSTSGSVYCIAVAYFHWGSTLPGVPNSGVEAVKVLKLYRVDSDLLLRFLSVENNDTGCMQQ